jgi:uncharacterized protein
MEYLYTCYLLKKEIFMTTCKNNILKTALVCVSGICIAGFLAQFTYNTIIQSKSVMSVKGAAEIPIQADSATWTIEYSSQSNDSYELYQYSQKAQKQIVDFLVSKQVPMANIRISSPIISYSNDNNFSGKTITNNFTLKGSIVVSTNQVASIAPMQAQIFNLAQNGILISNSDVNYYCTDIQSIKQELLDKAVASAQQTAEHLSAKSHTTLGGVRSMQQGMLTINDINGPYDGSTTKSLNKTARVVVSMDYQIK